MKIVSIITARGGSKGIPKKNIIKTLDRQILLASDNLLKEKLEKVCKVFHDTDFSSEDGLILMMKYTALADELNKNE